MNVPNRLKRFWVAMKPWVLIRLRQPSTYVGLIMKVAGIAGFVITDATAAHLAEGVAVLAGAALVAWNQSPKGDGTGGPIA